MTDFPERMPLAQTGAFNSILATIFFGCLVLGGSSLAARYTTWSDFPLWVSGTLLLLAALAGGLLGLTKEAYLLDFKREVILFERNFLGQNKVQIHWPLSEVKSVALFPMEPLRGRPHWSYGLLLVHRDGETLTVSLGDTDFREVVERGHALATKLGAPFLGEGPERRIQIAADSIRYL